MTANLVSHHNVVDHARICELLGPQAGEHVFVGGSLACGFFNEASDVDILFIVGNRRPPRVRSHQIFENNRRVDVQCYSRMEWLGISRKVGIAAQGGTIPSLEELTVYFRSSSGAPIWNQTRFHAMRSRYFSPLSLSTVLLRRNHESRRECLEKLSGLFALGSWDDVRAVLGELAILKISSYCARRGENCPNAKWRYEMLARIHGNGHPTVESYRALESRVAKVADRETAMAVLKEVLEPEETFEPSTAINVSLAKNVWCYQIGDEVVFVVGAMVHHVRGSGVTKFVEKLALPDGLPMAIPAAAHGRAIIDLLHRRKLIELRGRVSANSSSSVELPEDMINISTESLQAFSHRRLLQWRAYIDLQSYRDDNRGAREAGQWEAALIAARRELQEAVRVAIMEKLGFSVDFHSASVQQCLPESAQEILRLTQLFPVQMTEMKECAEACQKLAAKLLAVAGLSFPGNIRDARGHDSLFHYGRTLFQLFQKHGNEVPVEPAIIEKMRNMPDSSKELSQYYQEEANAR